MKLFCHILFFVCIALQGIAQQVGMYNHYFFNQFIYNPAFAGTGNTQATLISRAQWTGFSGAPQLNIFTMDGAIKNKKAGLGLMLISDKRGLNQRTGGSLAYSYKVSFNEETHLLFGLSLGLINQTFDFSKAISENYTDPTLFSSAQQKITFDGSGGLAFIWKGLTVGASALQVLGNRVNYVDNTEIRTFYSQVRHYIGSVKYKFYLSEDKGLSLAPMALVRIVPNTPMQYEGNVTLDWYNKLWVGGTYKSNYALAVNAGFYLNKKLAIGYSYEVITSSIGKYAGVSHEVMVNFRFGGVKKETDPDSAKADLQKQVAKDSAYQHKIDSLQGQLSESSEDIKKLNDKLKEQTKAQAQTQDQVQNLEKKIQDLTAEMALNQNSVPTNNAAANNTSSENTQSNTGKTTTGNRTENNPPSSNAPNQNLGIPDKLNKKAIESDIFIASDAVAGYKNQGNTSAKPAYYVVVGTFFYRDFAEAEMKRFKSKGYPQSGLVFSEARQYNYIFVATFSSIQEAISKAKSVKQSGSNNDAWILQLTK